MRPYRTNRRDVPLVEGLSPREGWINMQVQFLIDEKTAGSDKFVLGWTVLPPGARHDRHRHFNAEEFLLVIKGHGEIYTDEVRVKAMLFSRNAVTGMALITRPMMK